MRYTRFQFRNFRGIRETKLDLTLKDVVHRVVTLVGLNESGKTTVLEAIDLFYPTSVESVADVSPKQLSAWKPKDPFDLIPISARTNFGGSISVAATVILDEQDVEMIARSMAEKLGVAVVLTSDPITITQEWRFSDSKHTGTHTLWPGDLGTVRPAKARKDRPLSKAASPEAWAAVIKEIRSRLPQIWYFPSDLFDLPQEILLTPTDDETPENRFFRSLFQDVLTALGQDLDLQTHVIARARSTDSGDERALRQLLLDASREVTSSVVQAWNEIFDRSEMSSRQIRIELVPATNPPPAERRVAIRFALEDVDGTFSIHERSLGFRWFFVYLLVTKYRGQQRRNGSEMLFLFDEPASNLHPTAQGALLKSLARLSSNAVIVFTTHSHHLVNPDWLASAYVVTNGELDPGEVSPKATGLNTDISVRRYHDFAAQSPSRSHLFQPILDVLDYRPSLLESVPRLVLVEGKTDYYLLRYFSRYVATDERHRAINWTPGGGASGMKPLIRLYLGWGRNFLLLLDGDAEGLKAAARYRDEFGPDLEDRVLTLQSAAGSDAVTAIESILLAEDRLAFQGLVAAEDRTFKKDLFARGVQEAVARRATFTLSPQAVERLQAVCNSVLVALDGHEVTS